VGNYAQSFDRNIGKDTPLKIFSSETARPNEPKLSRKHLWKALYKIGHFVPIRLQTWPPQPILVSDWLISKKSSPLKPLCQMN
jgi:hypothetical protein